jgi:predicted transcriptional regulator
MQLSALLLTTLGLMAAVPMHAEQLQLLDFEIEDQFKNVHRRSDVQGNIVILIGSDKDGSPFNEAWGKAIHESLSDHPQYALISLLAHADLRGVPFFLKGHIRREFPQNPDQYVLMDWKGLIAKAYNFAPKSSNVLVFAPSGDLAHHASGREPDDETLDRLLTALRELLDEAT